jgi:hypothetical protein
MKLKAVCAFVLLFVFAISAEASSSGPSATPTPSLLDQMLMKVHLKHTGTPSAKGAKVQKHHEMELNLGVDPTPFKLSENREVKVTVTLFNRSSKKYVHLNFPTSQRIEILVRDASGKVVNTWSEDQSFANDPASVTVNPGERLEYTVSVATREMTAGEGYTIEASFPSYPELKVEQKVVPGK